MGENTRKRCGVMDELKVHKETMFKWEAKKKSGCICRAAGGHKLRKAGSSH